MSVTIVATYLKTESGDGYLLTYDNVSGPEEFVELVENALDTELAHVYSVDIDILYIGANHEQEDYTQALWLRIAEMRDEE